MPQQTTGNSSFHLDYRPADAWTLEKINATREKDYPQRAPLSPIGNTISLIDTICLALQ
jgi:hypothetical protein